MVKILLSETIKEGYTGCSRNLTENYIGIATACILYNNKIPDFFGMETYNINRLKTNEQTHKILKWFKENNVKVNLLKETVNDEHFYYIDIENKQDALLFKMMWF